MGKDAIAATMSGLPQILGLHVDNNLRPKWVYLTRHLGGLPDTVVAFPAYFSYSLPDRIVPRYRFLLSRGLMPPHLLPWCALLLGHSDKDFARIRKFPLKDYEDYRDALPDLLAAEAEAEAAKVKHEAQLAAEAKSSTGG